MALALDLRPLIVVREYAGGPVYAYPIANPRLWCRAETIEDAMAQQERFLAKHFEKIPAAQLADFVYPEEAELLELEVKVPRADLPRRIAIESPLTIPCVVVPDDPIRWVHVLPLAHTVHVREDEELERKVEEEITRLVGARELAGGEYRALLPADAHHLRRARVKTSRADIQDLGKRAADRRRKTGDRERELARKLLGEIGEDLGKKLAKAKGPPIIARDREVRALAALLSGSERLSVMLVGEEMTGKSAVVQALLSQSIVRFTERPVIATSGAQLVAGQSGFGMLEERIARVMKAAERLDAVLYFDNLGDLFAGHSGGIEDMASIMRPYLVEGRVRVIGELTPEQAELNERRHVGFFSALHRIAIEPLDAATTEQLLRKRVEYAREKEPERPTLADEAVAPLVELADRYLSYQAFPGKAVRLYEELRAIHEADRTDSGDVVRIGPHDVYRAFSVRSGIPMFLLREDLAMKHDEVVSFFQRRIIGQAEAIDRLGQTLCTVKAGLQPPSKPLANFLFVGPTGIGKTEVAKTLARFLFGSADRLLRFDMSEYMDPLAAERLIRGTDRDEGELTRKVRQQPFCVILLDEIEKAHPAVFDLLLQVCGEGRLSDARGKTTHFHNAMIIMTSNLGATHRRTSTGFGGEADSDPAAEQRHYLERVDAHFRPEFVNRIDRVVPFRSLTRDEIREVASVSLARILEREGLVNHNIELHVSDRLLETLANEGYSDTYGARALRRYLEDTLVNPIAAALSESGGDAEAAQVRAVLDGEEPTEAAGEVSGTRHLELVRGRVRVGVFRRPRKEVALIASDLQRIASMRRVAATLAHSAPIQEMRDRVAYLVAELASVSRRSEQSGGRAQVPPNYGAMTEEHARLQRVVDQLEGAVAELEGSEDLAIAALTDGDSASELLTDAREAYLGFERVFVQTVLGAGSRNSIAMTLQPQEQGWPLRRWLLPFAQQAEDRGWSFFVHLLGGEREPGEDWPKGCTWGPPRGPAWVRSKLAEVDDATLNAKWRGVLLRVRGPMAGAMLTFELGMHRFEREGGAQVHLRNRWAGQTFDIKPEQLDAAPYLLEKRLQRSELRLGNIVRHHHADGKLWIPATSTTFESEVSERYFERLEHILFPLIAASIARGEDPLGDDPTEEDDS